MTKNKAIHYLFIHGAGCTKSKWRELTPYFEDESVNVIDLPGRGTSEQPLPNTIEEHAQLISEQITSDTIVIGHSMGGLIGIELAAINQHIKGLVLLASFYELPVHPSILNDFAAGTFPDSIFYASYSKHIDEDLLAIEQREKEEANMNVVSTDFNACNEYTTGKETLASLNIPILALYGTGDRLLPPGSGEKLIDTNNHVEVHAIDDEKHYLMLENPSLVSKHIKQFANKLSR